MSSKAAHPLDIWLAGKGRNRAWLASQLGTSAATISRCISGHQWPSKPLIQALSKITRGSITANDFAHEPREGRAA